MGVLIISSQQNYNVPTLLAIWSPLFQYWLIISRRSSLFFTHLQARWDIFWSGQNDISIPTLSGRISFFIKLVLDDPHQQLNRISILKMSSRMHYNTCDHIFCKFWISCCKSCFLRDVVAETNSSSKGRNGLVKYFSCNLINCLIC